MRKLLHYLCRYASERLIGSVLDDVTPNDRRSIPHRNLMRVSMNQGEPVHRNSASAVHTTQKHVYPRQRKLAFPSGVQRLFGVRTRKEQIRVAEATSWSAHAQDSGVAKATLILVAHDVVSFCQRESLGSSSLHTFKNQVRAIR